MMDFNWGFEMKVASTPDEFFWSLKCLDVYFSFDLLIYDLI